MQSKVPATVIAVTAERIYTQCPKALVRSKLWDTETQIPRSALPSSGEILQALDADFDGPAYDAGYDAHLKKTMY